MMIIVNTKGGESETVSQMTKEVNGEVVPMTEEESKLKMLSEVSRIGGNPTTQIVKAMLFNLNGDIIKIEDIKKPVAE